MSEKKHRTRIYIAGPITKGVLVENVNQATEAFITLAKAGLSPFCPHWSIYSDQQKAGPNNTVKAVGTKEGNGRMSHAEWLGIDTAWVAVADAVLRLPGESKGADMEVAEAQANDIPVFHSLDDVLRWHEITVDLD